MQEHESLTGATMDEVYDVARKLIRKGGTNQEVETALIARGVNQKAAASVVINTLKMRADTRASGGAGMKNMLAGGICCIGGLAITLVTYQLAANGGIYIVAWGAILFGGIQFVRGLIEHMAR
ncbi:MAG: hypothetical protein QGH94_02475 [Phycisphaerae bacterium]|nr:hypothetical protein [Phycisphaerae bacterium]MDP7286839.1 hypothetical protein [Phycisphaerae bacterium]